MPRWHLTEFALRRGAHVLRCSVDAAEDLLCELMPTATYRETDRAGRELWRSPKSAHGLRWVLDVDADPPRVVWVGQAAPPEQHWDPAPDQAAERGEAEVRLMLDAGARRILHALSTGGHTPSTVVGRALRLLWEQQRGGGRAGGR